jgi:hypothetical protein
MPVRLSDEIRVSILVGDEEVHAYFPGYGNAEMQEAIKKLLSGRFQAGRGGRAPQDKTFEARVRFFNSMCTRVENVEDAAGNPLTADTEGWKAQIPANWKVSFALHFEEKNTLTEEEEGN